MKVINGTNVGSVLARTLSVAMLVLCAASSLQAANRIYFAQQAQASISYGDQDGLSFVTSPYSSEPNACGTAQDPSTGSLFWASSAGIRVASFDGLVLPSTLIPESGICGIAIDMLNRFIYWTNPVTEQVRRAHLDGTGVQTLFTENAGSDPQGLAIDPFGTSGLGFVYWTNMTANQVRFGHIDGSGAAHTFAPNEVNASGIAVDVNNKRPRSSASWGLLFRVDQSSLRA